MSRGRRKGLESAALFPALKSLEDDHGEMAFETPHRLALGLSLRLLACQVGAGTIVTAGLRDGDAGPR